MSDAGGLRGVRESVRLWFAPARIQQEGTTPDYRFSLANERTFLAWIRTALALIGGGFATDQFLDDLTHWVRVVLALALLVGGAACTLRAVNHWVRCERAIRHGTNLPVSRFPSALALLLTVLAAVLIAVVLLGWTG